MFFEKKQADLILTNGYLITMDKSRRVITDGAIVVNNGAITEVGRTADILAVYEGERYDCRGGVVHPGLVDAHEHLCLHITRGWEPDTFTVHDTWTKFESLAFPAVTDVEEQASVEFATLEMARNGITAFSDTGSAFNLDAIIESANRVGIRGVVGWLSGDCFPAELSFLSIDADKILSRIEKALQTYCDDRVYAGVQIAGMGDCSDEVVLGAKALAEKYKQVLFMHQCVTPEETELYMQRYGHGPIEHLEALGVLDEGTTLVHMIHLSDQDLQKVAQSGVSVVHCPAASIKYGLGAASRGKFPEMCEASVNIALGTDSGTWSDALDVLHLSYLAATLHREARLKITPVTSYSAFEMATLGGAKALGLEDIIGSLETGKRADIVVHSPDEISTLPAFDPFINLIYSARSKSVDTVLVDGEYIIKNKCAERVDEKAICANASKVASDFAKRIGYKVHTNWNIF